MWGLSPFSLKHPKVQLPTVAELLQGQRIEMPPIRQVSTTFKKAPKGRAGQDKQFDLGFN